MKIRPTGSVIPEPVASIATGGGESRAGDDGSSLVRGLPESLVGGFGLGPAVETLRIVEILTPTGGSAQHTKGTGTEMGSREAVDLEME